MYLEHCCDEMFCYDVVLCVAANSLDHGVKNELALSRRGEAVG